NAGVVSRRTRALCMLAQQTPKQAIILTTINALLQRVPPATIMQAASFRLATGTKLDRDALTAFLADNGYSRTGKVMEPGEFAVRGSIIDLFPAGEEEAIRIDCFDDEIESLTRFDPLTQASVGQTEPEVLLLPASE